MNWTEGHVHIAMRRYLRATGWHLIAGEFPGGSDHELYPLNVVDRAVAKDNSPDARRHSLGELIPDLVASKESNLIIVEAKVGYSGPDREKLVSLFGDRKNDMLAAIEKFAIEKKHEYLFPIAQFELHPVLAFLASKDAPVANNGFSYLRIRDDENAFFEGELSVCRK